jgi:putative transposase
MRTYTRARIAGGWYFFTVNLAERRGNDLLVWHIAELREAFRQTRRDHPFFMDAIVVLPDHLHCLWRLPADDDDFPTRWRLIKVRFSHRIAPGERISKSRRRKSERGVWQRRY